MTDVLIYITLVSMVEFVFFSYDKKAAQERRSRVPERTLFFLAVAGGSIGALAGMYLFRHKTQKVKFVVGIPFVLIVQILMIALWL